MSVVSVTVKAAGKALPVEYQLLSVDVRRTLNRLPSAELVLLDGDMPEQRFPVSDAGLLAPGAEVEILARYEGGADASGRDVSLFKGLVVRHGIEAGARGGVLRLELRDKAVKMTRPRRSQVSVDAKDSDVIGKLARAAGLSVQVDATNVVHDSLVQYDCSDWDWLVTRAEAVGLVVVVTDGALKVTKPVLPGHAALRVTWGSDIHDLEFTCDALGQDASVATQSWDVRTQKLAQAQGQKPPAPGQGRLTGTQAATALGFAAATLLHGAALQAAEAKSWADGEALRNQLGLLRGRVRVQGVGKIALLDAVDIIGVAKAFTGKALVTGLCHRISDGDWTTDLQFGLAPTPHHRQPEIARAGAGGLLPPAAGLHIGVVEAVSGDPLNEHRIKVLVPGLGSNAPGLWARLASPEAGKGRGFHFWPEPGDEVVLGFFNDDPRQPVVLGALFGSKNTPPDAITDSSDKNNLRGLVTRSGLTLGLDDEKKQLSLQTPSGAKLLLDDEAEAIVISDKHGNEITLDKGGISIKSAKDFLLDAGGGNVSVKGSKIDLN